jgi:hypothetical protein
MERLPEVTSKVTTLARGSGMEDPPPSSTRSTTSSTLKGGAPEHLSRIRRNTFRA